MATHPLLYPIYIILKFDGIDWVLVSFDKIDLYPALFLEWDWIDWVLDSFDKMGLCPALFLKWDGIDRVFRFFWQNQPLPCPIFEMGLNRLSF